MRSLNKGGAYIKWNGPFFKNLVIHLTDCLKFYVLLIKDRLDIKDKTIGLTFLLKYSRTREEEIESTSAIQVQYNLET